MILIHIEGIKGDSKIPGYKDKNWFSVENFGFGVVRESKESAKAGTDDITIGVGELQECTFEKTTDIGTAMLFKYALSGGPLDYAEIHFVQTRDDSQGKQAVYPYLMIKLTPCFIKTWNVSGSSDERPTENVSLWYQKIELSYIPYAKDDQGKFVSKEHEQAGWDQVVNNSWGDFKFEVPKG